MTEDNTDTFPADEFMAVEIEDKILQNMPFELKLDIVACLLANLMEENVQESKDLPRVLADFNEKVKGKFTGPLN